MTRGHWITWSLLLLASACSKAEVASSPPAAKTGGGEPTSEPTEAMGQKMWHHFWDVAEARDAVIAGKLENVRAPLLRLSKSVHVVEDTPHDWIPWIDEMETEAARGAQSQTLDAAAHAVAAIAQRCGDCHRATRGGPEIENDVQAFDAHGRTGLRGAMAQHVWASEELWLGMTVPHHPSWAAGAKALSETQLPPATGEQAATTDAATNNTTATASSGTTAEPTQTIDPAMHAKLEAVRALGERALAAAKPFEMAQVYGDLIARCGDCHAKR